MSTGAYLSNIRNKKTGAKELKLPLVADLDGNGVPDALPIDLIRRPPVGEVTTGIIYPQRFFAIASLRILLSDTEAEINLLPTVLTAGAVNLTTGTAYAGTAHALKPPLAAGPAVATSVLASAALPANTYKTWYATGAPLLGGWIKIEMLRNDTGVWQDVTTEILALGIAGRNLADYSASAASRWNTVGSVYGTSMCPEPNPNAIIRLQRVRDVPSSMAPCGVTPTGAGTSTVLTSVSRGCYRLLAEHAV